MDSIPLRVEEMNQTYCREMGLDIVEYPLFRVFQLIYTTISIVTIPMLLYVMQKYIFGATFHRNLKIIFLMYFSAALLHAIIYPVVQILVVTGSIVTTYSTEHFKAAVPSMINIPPATVALMNRMAVTGLVVSLVCILGLFAALQINKRRSNLKTLDLTSRYQTRENVITTQFATHLASLQVGSFVIYGSGGLFARVIGQQLFENNLKMYFAIRQILYVIPIFVFVLAIFSAYRLKRYQLEREESVRSMVMMESRGPMGCRNYEDIIFKSWQIKPA
ncbi:integral membrane protein [Oesophagostomum dentatum]|uniref:Integral membrane protein n=1 Tax=Oesophagostomum dentatum TaxID=61180 RepID=A0A0B1TEC3_OESDE|nr:integral membrane protein [Oesophagostomum dentatum]